MTYPCCKDHHLIPRLLSSFASSIQAYEVIKQQFPTPIYFIYIFCNNIGLGTVFDIEYVVCLFQGVYACKPMCFSYYYFCLFLMCSWFFNYSHGKRAMNKMKWTKTCINEKQENKNIFFSTKRCESVLFQMKTEEPRLSSIELEAKSFVIQNIKRSFNRLVDPFFGMQ